MGSLIPAYDLGATIRAAVLDELATGQQRDRELRGKALRLASPKDRDEAVFYGIMPPITHMRAGLSAIIPTVHATLSPR